MAASDAAIRAFAAIEIGDAARDAIASLIRRLRAIPSRVSWVRPENLHLTLRFLGEVDAARIEAYAARVRGEIAAIPAFEATVRGVGAFPNARRASVIWAGAESTDDALGQMYSIAERAAQAAGLPAETRPFVSHVTLGRVRRESRSVDVSRYLEQERGFDAGAFTVGAVSLFSSELTPHGAQYKRLHRLTLDGIRGTRDV